MRDEFRKELEDSLFIHSMLPLHRERSLEAEFPNKKVLDRKNVWTAREQISTPAAGEKGVLLVLTEEEQSCVKITAPLRSDRWPKGAPEDGDYSNFGTAEVHFSLPGENLTAYNRLHFWVRPEVKGAGTVHLNVGIRNDGEQKIPDRYVREGFTVFDLNNMEWNECFWEFTSLPRDKVMEIQFYIFLCGQDVAMGEELTYYYKDIVLEQVENPEKELGWECAENSIVLSSAGYFTKGKKSAVANMVADFFEVIEESTGKSVYRGAAKLVENKNGCFQVLDFSQISGEGTYYLQAGEVRSQSFEITNNLMEENIWRVLNFLYGERCGMPIAGKHGTCHQDITARHKGLTMSFVGGWHDAGDVSQQSAQTGEVVHALLEAAAGYRGKNPLLYKRIVEEARWGLDFILRTRFKDGYRATSAGATRWTNNLTGDMDDVETRVYNHAYENFLFAGIEAYSYLQLKEEDSPLAWGSLEAAKEDFAFAENRFENFGAEAVQMFEHTYNSGLSQYYAVIVWAASYLYEATGEETYAKKAENWCDKLLQCQETGAAGLPFDGFFYREEDHRTIVHFNHQSRAQQFMQALTEICRSQPESPKRPLWEEAMKRYGSYLKAIAGNTAPYGMLPAGVHKMDEYEDEKTFPYLHVTCSYEQERENYREQLAGGTPVRDGYVLRNFPVWFSFRGNTAVMLAEGKAASLVGRYFGDEELLQMGREQLYWMFGKNPFGHSLMYGAGRRYPAQYAVLPGECVGELPVGIETFNNGDEPYWPQGNNATYREVWTSAASRWLWLAADYTVENMED
ncbi:glycoside hydrolase family 9 protein [Kineothrix sedimenti]|uniref:Glycoside hydrolase family 9 protein n=1 Tax=Kineothrix sedimenti TaxID=3123317 RepID=A0ABZ3EU76_9FIRM